MKHHKSESPASSLEDIKKQLNNDNIPNHIAIIMDGNGRWAKKKNRPRAFGHKAGVDALEIIIEACIDYNVKHLSVFAFSSENWNRPSLEVSFLLKLLKTQIEFQKQKLINQNVRTRILGNLSKIPKDTLNVIHCLENETKKFDKLNLNIFISYGSREEIIDTANRIISDNKNLKTPKIWFIKTQN